MYERDQQRERGSEGGREIESNGIRRVCAECTSEIVCVFDDSALPTVFGVIVVRNHSASQTIVLNCEYADGNIRYVVADGLVFRRYGARTI